MKYSLCSLFLFCCGCLPMLLAAQGDSSAKTAKRQSLVYIHYFLRNNEVPYVKVQAKSKVENAFLPVAGVKVTLYLDKDSASDALIGQVLTNHNGEASLGLPASLANTWKSGGSHTFYARTAANKDFDAVSENLPIVMGKLEIDTAAGETGHTVVAHLMKKEGETWVPMPEVDVKLAVRRYGGNLNISNDKETYPTDSTGTATGEFQRTKLPGGANGKLELLAIVEDNDDVGNLETSITVPWGVTYQAANEFGERSLWATGRRAPLWLLVMALGCIIGVWSVIIYLITRIVKIKKLGVQRTA